MSNACRLNIIFHSVSNDFNRTIQFDDVEGELEINTLYTDEWEASTDRSIYDLRLRISIDTITHKNRYIKLSNSTLPISPSMLAQDLIDFETAGHPFTRQKKETADLTAAIYIEFKISSPTRIKNDVISLAKDFRTITLEFVEPNEPGDICLDSTRHDDIREDLLNMEVSEEAMSGNEYFKSISLHAFISYLQSIEEWRDFDFTKVIEEESTPPPSTGSDNVRRLG